MPISYGTDYLYAGSRLNNTIALVGGKPSTIYGINSDGVHYCPISSTADKTAPVELLDLSPIKLGYTPKPISPGRGGGLVPVFVCRKASRQWKQGLRADNLAYITPEGRVRGGATSFLIPAIPSLHAGTYVTPSGAMERVDCGEAGSWAFSRNFAVGQKTVDGFTLYYKGAVVGSLASNSYGQVQHQIKDKYNFLTEEFLETING